MAKKLIKLTKPQLRQIIQNAVQNYLESDTNSTENPTIDGEIPYTGEIKGFGDTEYIKKRINEGLITTYPIDKTVDIVTRRFNLNPNQIQKQDIDDNGIVVTLLSIVLPISISKNVIGNITQVMKTCGYFVIHPFTPHPYDKRYGVLSYEPIFSSDISSKIRSECQYLYHSTSTTLVPKIIKNGLIPHSKNSIFLYTDRTFCMKGDNLSKEQLVTLKNVQTARNSTHPQYRNPHDNLKYSLITINVSKIPENVKMYIDPMSQRAIFTYDVIPPTAIEDITPFTL